MRKHLTLSDRKSIEKCLSQGVSFAEIGRRLEVAPCSISREVRRHLVQWEKGGWGRCMNDCVHQKSCFQYDLCGASPACSKKCSTCPRCNSVCPEFEAEECSRLLKPPYVCNGCRERRGCTLKKRLYQARNAEDEYTRVLHEARRGFNLCSEELKAIDEFFFEGDSSRAVGFSYHCFATKSGALFGKHGAASYPRGGDRRPQSRHDQGL